MRSGPQPSAARALGMRSFCAGPKRRRPRDDRSSLDIEARKVSNRKTTRTSRSRQPSVSARLVRTREAAHYLGIGEKAIRQFVLKGELAFVQLRPGNSPFLIDVHDLDRFIEARKTRLDD
jgi:excisionase family DNA binding protein